MSSLSSMEKSTVTNPRGGQVLFHRFDFFKNNPTIVHQDHLTYAFNSAGVNGDTLIDPFTVYFDGLSSNASIKKDEGKDAEDLAKSGTQLFTSPGIIDQHQIDLGNKISSPKARPLAIGKRKAIEGSGGAGKIAAAPTYQCRTTICKNNGTTSPYPFKWANANKASSGFIQGAIGQWRDNNMVWRKGTNEIVPAIDPRKNRFRGKDGTIQYLEASREWKLRYSWCLGLPLEWGIDNYDGRANERNKGAIDCEHKLPLSWQVLFGCGPATVLSWYKENPSAAAGDAISGFSSDLETRTQFSTAQENDEFLRVKYAVREECYAWELAKMNREYKNQVVFINIVVDPTTHRIKYVIARNAISRMINAMCNNKFSFEMQEGRINEWERIIINIMAENGIVSEEGIKNKIKEVRIEYNISQTSGSGNWREWLNDLLKFAFDYERTKWQNVASAKRDRLRNEGIIGVINLFLSDKQKSAIGTYNRMFIYENIITQLLRLVALLNYNVNEVCRNMVPSSSSVSSSSVSSSSLPYDIGIRYNLFLNYERIKRYVINKIAKRDTTYLDWVTKDAQSMLKICNNSGEIGPLETTSIGSDGKASYNGTTAHLHTDLNNNAIFLNDSKDLLKNLYNFGPQATTTQSNASLTFLANLRNKNDIYRDLNRNDGDFQQIGGYLEKRKIDKHKGSSRSSGEGKATNDSVFLPDGFWELEDNVFAFYAADNVDPTGYEGGVDTSSDSPTSQSTKSSHSQSDSAKSSQSEKSSPFPSPSRQGVQQGDKQDFGGGGSGGGGEYIYNERDKPQRIYFPFGAKEGQVTTINIVDEQGNRRKVQYLHRSYLPPDRPKDRTRSFIDLTLNELDNQSSGNEGGDEYSQGAWSPQRSHNISSSMGSLLQQMQSASNEERQRQLELARRSGISLRPGSPRFGLARRQGSKDKDNLLKMTLSEATRQDQPASAAPEAAPRSSSFNSDALPPIKGLKNAAMEAKKSGNQNVDQQFETWLKTWHSGGQDGWRYCTKCFTSGTVGGGFYRDKDNEWEITCSKCASVDNVPEHPPRDYGGRKKTKKRRKKRKKRTRRKRKYRKKTRKRRKRRKKTRKH